MYNRKNYFLTSFVSATYIWVNEGSLFFFAVKVKKKVNFFRVHAMKVPRESRGIAPHIPKLGIRWK